MTLTTTRRREFSAKLKEQIVERATNADGQICCEGCGQVLGYKKWQIDHTLAEEFVTDKSKPLTIEDGRLLGQACCHAPKTADDIRKLRKGDRQRRYDRGIRQTRNPLPGSKASGWRKPFNGPPERRT